MAVGKEILYFCQKAVRNALNWFGADPGGKLHSLKLQTYH